MCVWVCAIIIATSGGERPQDLPNGSRVSLAKDADRWAVLMAFSLVLAPLLLVLFGWFVSVCLLVIIAEAEDATSL